MTEVLTPYLPRLENKQRLKMFAEFHRDNPQVFRLFRKFARQALESRPSRRFGARMIGERIRWYTTVETTDSDFKINDHHWPYYARMLMLAHREFADFFEIRSARFDATEKELLRVLDGTHL